MSGFVVDASVAIKWLVDEPGAEIASLLFWSYRRRICSARPDLRPKCANILWKKSCATS